MPKLLYGLLFRILFQFPDKWLKSRRVARPYFNLLFWVSEHA